MTKPRRMKARRVEARDLSAADEAAHIIEQARQGVTCVVTLGPLLFFSTATGDAWVLDLTDSLALCLARGGEFLPARIIDSSESFSIQRTHTFTIDGEAMVFLDEAGSGTSVIGYPVDEIQRFCPACGG